jgi:hypothetical protein
MAACSKCGAQLNPQERFCGNCGWDASAAPPQQTAPQRAVSQPAVSQQVAYTPPPAQAAVGHRCGCAARAAFGLGVGGGLLGIVWGALGPYLSLKSPSHIAWFLTYAGSNPYGTGLRPEILLVIGLVLGVFAVLGAALATRAVMVARIVLLICGLGGFALGASWLIPGALMLTAAGLAIAAKPQQ